MTTETTLTASQINIIAAELTGTEPTRAATKDRAIGKLRAAISTAFGEAQADKITAQVLAAPTAETASTILRLEADEKVKRASPKARRAALTLIENEAPAPETAKPAREKKARAAKADKVPGKRASILEAAQRGELPAAPDFSAETHKRFRAKLAAVVAATEAGDLDALRAFQINPVSSSPKAIAKYRDLAVIALEARAAKAGAAA